MKTTDKNLTVAKQESLLATLATRFEKNKQRHHGIDWKDVRSRLEKQPDKMRTLEAMEASGGEPDVVSFSDQKKDVFFADCAPESPAGRRSICFDHEALAARKANKPGHSAMEMAKEMGIELLNETQYRELQELGKFDLKTSSWILTPPHIRKLGGALFCDRRYDTVFLYHNGADSYYAARGFRGWVTV